MNYVCTKRTRIIFLSILLMGVIIGSYSIVSRTPSHNRVWEIGQERQPVVSFEGNQFTIENFRDFTWTGELEADGVYRTKTYDFSQLTSVDIISSHFHWFEGIAHIMFAFNFAHDEPLILSVESRRESHEEFSPFWGMARQFELIYVLGSSRDLIGARLGVREERVYRFPTALTPDEARSFLRVLLEDVNAQANQPSFYHTITRNCTNLVTNRLADTTRFALPFSWRIILPGYVAPLLFETGLVADTTADTSKEVFRITTE